MVDTLALASPPGLAGRTVYQKRRTLVARLMIKGASRPVIIAAARGNAAGTSPSCDGVEPHRKASLSAYKPAAQAGVTCTQRRGDGHLEYLVLGITGVVHLLDVVVLHWVGVQAELLHISAQRLRQGKQ